MMAWSLLPSSLLSVIYEYDDTYRQYFQAKVLVELKSKYPPIIIVTRNDGVILQYSVCTKEYYSNNRSVFFLHGPFKEFRGDELNNTISLLSCCYYKNGFKVGRERMYFHKPANNFWQEKYFSFVEKKSILTGWMRQYFSNGRLINEVYRDEKGKRQGHSISYFENGKVWTKCFYREDVFDGLYYVYYPTGIMEEIIEFEKGKMHGMHRKYNKDGSLKFNYTYVRGKRL